MNKLSIIIPAYNEEKTIEEIIRRVKKQKVFNLHKEIIVVNDGSTDKTEKLIKKNEEKIYVFFNKGLA